MVQVRAEKLLEPLAHVLLVLTVWSRRPNGEIALGGATDKGGGGGGVERGGGGVTNDNA